MSRHCIRVVLIIDMMALRNTHVFFLEFSLEILHDSSIKSAAPFLTLTSIGSFWALIYSIGSSSNILKSSLVSLTKFNTSSCRNDIQGDDSTLDNSGRNCLRDSGTFMNV